MEKQKSNFAVLIKAAHGPEMIEPDNGERFTLGEMQRLVGGYVEMVPRLTCGKSLKMYVDEDGLLKQLPVNGLASHLAQQTIVGDVVVCPTHMFTF